MANCCQSDAVLTSTQSVSTQGPLIGSQRPARLALQIAENSSGLWCSIQA